MEINEKNNIIDIQKIPDEIFESEINDIDIPCGVIHLFSKEEFFEGQAGYIYNKIDMKLIGEWIGKQFFVIGYDSTCGDPIIINIEDKELPVYSMFHDDWTTLEKISDSFKKYVEILKLLNEAKLESNTSQEKIDELLFKIKNIVPEGIDYWNSIFTAK